jgi:hypothetical protein
MQSDITRAALTASLLHDTTTGAFPENHDSQMEDDTADLVRELQSLNQTLEARIADLTFRREQTLDRFVVPAESPRPQPAYTA